jgi:hypothetical protein
MVRSLDMHGHWVNSIAMSSDHVMRNSPPTESEVHAPLLFLHCFIVTL